MRQQLNFEEQWNPEVVIDNERRHDGQRKRKVNCRMQCHGRVGSTESVLGTHHGLN